MSSRTPKAILLDLDDTILDDSSTVDACWTAACATYCDEYSRLDPLTLHAAIKSRGEWFWSDADRHRLGRLNLDAARREVVRMALEQVNISDDDLATKIAGIYCEQRELTMQPLPDAVATVRWLREQGVRLALLTNGASEAQRKKIRRFGLEDLFDVVLVEGEIGFGKPNERIYRLALDQLRVGPTQAWMIGDNLEWDVGAPQTLGVFAIWIDVRGKGLPEETRIRPNRIVRALSELRGRLV